MGIRGIAMRQTLVLLTIWALGGAWSGGCEAGTADTDLAIANGIMALAKRMGRNPRELAAEVIAALPPLDAVSKLEVAGPGFINIGLADTYLGAQVSHLHNHPVELIPTHLVGDEVLQPS